jgi:alkaline phosphatase
MMKPIGMLTFSLTTILFMGPGEAEPAKSAILLIGDGMGISHVTAARIYQKNARDGALELDEFERVALVRTHSSDMTVTDSAAAATALATGKKTRYGSAGVDADGKDLDTVLERAKAAGKSVGIVTTARVTHATPAAFYANVRDRDDEEAIASQLLAYGEIDVVLGGGREFFLPESVRDAESFRNGSREDKRNLMEEAKEAGYSVVDRESEFLKLKEQLGTDSFPKKVLGLFNFSKMEYVYRRPKDRWGEPSLSEMTAFAISVLEQNPNGFFLMVEGALIDHASHENWGRVALEEVLAFDEAVGVARGFQQSHPDTLVVATADHETGGLSINGYTSVDIGGEDLFVADATGGITEVLSFSAGPGATRRKGADPSSALNYRQPALHATESAPHTGEDVLAWAEGPGAERITGTLGNDEVGQAILDALFGE